MFDDEFLPLIKAWVLNWKMDEELLSFAKKLGKRYTVAVLSNSEQSYEEKYDGRLSKVFWPIVYSHRVRMVKPDKEMFEYCLKKLGLAAEECVVVDDAPENIKAAKELGMHAVLYKNLNDLEKQLELFGVRT